MYFTCPAEVQFTGVEMKKAALSILEQRAAAAGLTNVRCHAGMIETFSEPFDVGMALHCCGNATDYAMLKCVQQRAAVLACPCCVGKLVFSMAGGSSFSPHVKQWHGLLQRQQAHSPSGEHAGEQQQQQQDSQGYMGNHQSDQNGQHSGHQQLQTPVLMSTEASAGSVPEVRHPRSDALLRCLPDPQRAFKLIASQADTAVHKSAAAGDGEGEGGEDGRSQVLQPQQDVLVTAAAACKVHVELDRREAAREAGYACALFKLFQYQHQAKTDFLVGVPREMACWAFLHPLLD
jgi:hypothetical protein